MDSYIRNQLEGTVGSTTLQPRINWLIKLSKNFSGANSFSFLNDFKKVISIISDTKSINTKWTRLSHIMQAIKSDPSLIDPEVLAKYTKFHGELKKDREEKNLKNEKTESQEERLDLTLSDRQSQLDSEIEKLFQSKKVPYRAFTAASIKKIDHRFAKHLQDLVVCGCYVYQEALRNDWGGIVIITSTRHRDLTDQNYLYTSGNVMRLYMNKYKNAKSMGHQKINVRPELMRLLKIWFSLIKFMTGSPAEHVLYYDIQTTKPKFAWLEKEDSLRRYIPIASEKVFGTPLSINDYRHLWEVDIQQDPAYAHMTKEERLAIHARLLHGEFAASFYNVH